MAANPICRLLLFDRKDECIFVSPMVHDWEGRRLVLGQYNDRLKLKLPPFVRYELHEIMERGKSRGIPKFFKGFQGWKRGLSK